MISDGPEWMIYVDGWPKAVEGTAWRLLETLCADAANDLLRDRGKGTTPLQSWLIDLAEHDPRRQVLDWSYPFGDSEPWLPTWRPVQAEDAWWAARLVNVLDLSAKAVRQLVTGAPPPAPGRREMEKIGDPDNFLTAAESIWLWYTHQGCWEHFGLRIKRSEPTHAKELIEEYSAGGHALNERQSRLRTDPYAVVAVDSPGFQIWDARVKAVQSECVAALESGNPFGHYDHNSANALSKAIEELRNAGRGYGWPPQVAAPPPAGTPRQYPSSPSDTPTGDRRGEPSTGRPPRILVDIGRTTLSSEGTVYDVPSQQALRWVAVLAKTPGQWFSARELETADPRTRQAANRPPQERATATRATPHRITAR